MATELDNVLVPEALAIIEEFGQNAVFQTVSKAYDPTTRLTTDSGADDITRKITPPELMNRYADGDLIKEGDVKILVAASGLTFTPVEDQKVTIASETWRIIRVTRVFSGELIAIWQLQLRK